jgi:glycosyltransferase involved in cell wall biosynthesis
MRILMIAPEPFFQPRGTPFSEYYRARAFTELGHQVDMVTYSIGSDVSIPGLRIYRAARVPGVRSVRIGPSLAKIPLDVVLFFSAIRRLLTRRYDLLDCHEEAGLMGVVLSRVFGLPTVYDMHSSLPEQLSNFRFSRSRLLRWLFDVGERWCIRGSDAVIVICPYLKDVVGRVDPDRPSFLIENSPLAESGEPAGAAEVSNLRRSLGLDNAKIILYTGTFEAYQGFELLMDAIQKVVQQEPQAHLLMVGGHPEQVRDAEQLARNKGLEGKVTFTGQRPPSEMTLYLSVGDILVSPRSRGTNTPLKIYSYLRAGKPIVATRLLTHTQVLNDDVAALTEPQPEAFAEAMVALIREPERARNLGQNARRLSEESYSYERYVENTRRLFEFFSRSPQKGAVSRASIG